MAARPAPLPLETLELYHAPEAAGALLRRFLRKAHGNLLSAPNSWARTSSNCSVELFSHLILQSWIRGIRHYLLQTISQPNLNSWALEHNRICSAAWFVYDILNREVDEKQLKQSIFYYVQNSTLIWKSRSKTCRKILLHNNHAQKKMYKNTAVDRITRSLAVIDRLGR